jgi:hypothetical protein
MTYGEIFVHPSAWLITFFFTAILTPGKNIDSIQAVLIGLITYFILSSSSSPLLSHLYSLLIPFHSSTSSTFSPRPSLSRSLFSFFFYSVTQIS